LGWFVRVGLRDGYFPPFAVRLRRMGHPGGLGGEGGGLGVCFGVLFFDELGLGGEIAELGVGGEVFDGLEVGGGQVEAGELEAVEDEAGALVVDGAGGDALEDLGDGGEDAAAVVEREQLEGGGARAAGAEVVDGAAGGVVVVAELFAAEGGAAAAVAVGEDVAAAVAGGGLFGWLEDRFGHVGTPLLGFWS
jgi:hypothetical protein